MSVKDVYVVLHQGLDYDPERSTFTRVVAVLDNKENTVRLMMRF